MNDFEKAMFIFFDEWGGSPLFAAEHEMLLFHGLDIDDIIAEAGAADYRLFNDLYDLGWMLTEDGESFMSYRWGSC